MSTLTPVHCRTDLRKRSTVVSKSAFSPNGVNHEESHSHAVDRVIGSGDGKSAHAVVAVAEDLDAHAVVLLSQLVEAAKEVVKGSDQLLSGKLFRKWSEVHDIGVKKALERKNSFSVSML